MKLRKSLVLTSACAFALANAAQAQDTGQKSAPSLEHSSPLDEIIVTARRKEESLQDVPVTVNVVTAEDIENLNLRQFEEIQTVMPGLVLQGSTATVRGIAFNQLVSGSNGTIDFYWNDAPVPATSLFQAMFDVGQIELLRGPQGTLRGRAAPSGSMTVTTRRPDLTEFGGYATATGTDDKDMNANGAINVPIVNDMLAIRVAGLWEHTNGDGVDSVYRLHDPDVIVKAGRATIRFEPADFLAFNLTYQKYQRESERYTQVESLQAIDPAGTPSRVFIRGQDRLAAQDLPIRGDSDTDLWNLQAQAAFLGQQLNYVGQLFETSGKTKGIGDIGDYYGPGQPDFRQGYGNYDVTEPETKAHELRLSSQERLFGMFDYIVGGFYQKLNSPTTSNIAILGPTSVTYSPLVRFNESVEKSFFGNVTLHLGDKTELAAGARRINYEQHSGVLRNGAPVAAAALDVEFQSTIYTGSAKYQFNDDLMTYATVGTSWRPGTIVIGNTNATPSPLEISFMNLPPEESISYELGTKASWLDKRMRLNAALFYQKFENYPYRPSSQVYFIQSRVPPVVGPQPAGGFNFAAAVPAEVYGVEVEWSYAPADSFDLGINAAYSNSKIDNGLIPCNDYSPRDGVPDSTSTPPTFAVINAAVGTDNLSACRVNYRVTTSPLLSASGQAEYRVSMGSNLDGYVRGLVSFYGSSQVDPTTAIDDVDAYAIWNLYLGIRAPKGDWDVSVYAKNLTNDLRVLSRSVTELTTSGNRTGYRTVTSVDPREIGLSLRYSFGSR